MTLQTRNMNTRNFVSSRRQTAISKYLFSPRTNETYDLLQRIFDQLQYYEDHYQLYNSSIEFRCIAAVIGEQHTFNITMIRNFFMNPKLQLTHIVEIDLSGMFKQITDFSYFFAGMPNLEVVNLTGCDFSNTTLLHGTFRDCPKLHTIIGLECLFASKPTDIEHCFDNTGFKTLDLSGWTNLKYSRTSHKFIHHMMNLETLRLNNITFESMETIDNLISDCPKLKTFECYEIHFPSARYVHYAFAELPLCDNIHTWENKEFRRLQSLKGGSTCFHKSEPLKRFAEFETWEA